MAWRHSVGARSFVFDDLKTLLARATPLRSGDALAGIAADSEAERVAAKMALAEAMWGLVLADGEIHEHEHYLTRKISNLLDLAPADLSAAKANAVRTAAGER